MGPRVETSRLNLRLLESSDAKTVQHSVLIHLIWGQNHPNS